MQDYQTQLYTFRQGRQTADRGPNSALRDKKCGPRETFKLKKCYLKTIEKIVFLVITFNWGFI